MKVVAGCTPGVPTEKNIVPLLERMLDGTECFCAVALRKNAQETYTRDEIMSMVRPYVGLNRAEFEAELISMGSRPLVALSSEQRFILANETRMKGLRTAMVELELAKSYLTMLDAESLMDLSAFQNLGRLEAVRMPPTSQKSSFFKYHKFPESQGTPDFFECPVFFQLS